MSIMENWKMNKEQITFKFAHEYLILWRNAQREKNREEEKQKAIEDGDMHKVITMNLEQVETKYRIQELKRMSNSLELDWKEVRKLVEKEMHLWGIDYV